MKKIMQAASRSNAKTFTTVLYPGIISSQPLKSEGRLVCSPLQVFMLSEDHVINSPSCTYVLWLQMTALSYKMCFQYGKKASIPLNVVECICL